MPSSASFAEKTPAENIIESGFEAVRITALKNALPEYETLSRPDLVKG